MGFKEVSFTANPAAPAQPTQPWQQNSQDLMRQRAMLTALAGQNMAPKGLTQVSGHVVNTALPDAIQRIAGALMLKNGMSDLDKREAAINAAQMTAQNNARARLAQLNPRDMPGLLAASNEIGATGVDITKDPNYAALLEIVKQAEIEKGKAPEYGDVKFDAQGPYRLGKKGETLRLQGIGKDQKMANVNGVYVDENAATPGQVAPPNYNDLITLGPDGKPQVNQPLLDAKKQVAEAGANRQSVIVEGEKAFQKGMGDLDSKELNELRANAKSAQKSLQTVQSLRSAIKKGVYSGGGANAKTAVASIIAGITGVSPKGLPGSEEFNADASKLVLDHIKSLGANPSNADRIFIEKTVPQLWQSPQARDALISRIEQSARQQIEVYRKANAYGREHSGLGGFPLYESLPDDAPQQGPQSGDGWSYGGVVK